LKAGKKINNSLAVWTRFSEKLRNFCVHKETNNVVFLMRIDKDKCQVLLDKEYEGISHMNLKMNYLSNHLFICV
jgi:hypothetical protein